MTPKTVCPTCGVSRSYPPSILAKLKSPTCRKCLHGHKPKVICSKCGKERYKGRPSIAKLLKTALCRKCWKAEERSKWVEVKCPRCGLAREMAPGDAAKLSTGICLHCPRHSPGEIPDSYDAGYVVGVVMGDGSIWARKCQNGSMAYGIVLMVTSRAFADKFATVLGSVLGKTLKAKSSIRSLKGNESIKMPAKVLEVYRVMTSSRDWYDRLHPSKKLRNLDWVLGRSAGFRRGFLDGMVDSEGYVSHKNEYTDVAGKDIGLLSVTGSVAESLGLKAKIYGPYHYARGVAHLRIAGCLEKTA